MFAQNNKDDYVRQAYVAAMSIRCSNKDVSICLITNDSVDIQYKHMFDYIIPMQNVNYNDEGEWKIHNRWQIYNCTPYDQTIVMDTDMLVLDDISSWWNYLQTKELFFVSNVKTYKNENVIDNYYRKAFKKYNLPNIYSGFHYFKKSDFSHTFYKCLEDVLKNWKVFYNEFAGGTVYQKQASVDLSCAIACQILGVESKILDIGIDYPTFTHMKTHIQGWSTPNSNSWQRIVGTYFTKECELKIGNFQQHGIFHYTEKDFLTDEIVNTYKSFLRN
jgi:hypothetical protein